MRDGTSNRTEAKTLSNRLMWSEYVSDDTISNTKYNVVTTRGNSSVTIMTADWERRVFSVFIVRDFGNTKGLALLSSDDYLYTSHRFVFAIGIDFVNDVASRQFTVVVDPNDERPTLLSVIAPGVSAWLVSFIDRSLFPSSCVCLLTFCFETATNRPRTV
jgi:hypothetical protein